MILQLLRRMILTIKEKKIESYITSLKSKGLSLGNNTTILEPFFLDPQHCFLISIGDNCTLAPNTRMIAHDASTKQYLGSTRVGNITIHDNCFIGDSVIILPNVSVGPNSIVGAGSVVNKNIPENVVAAGNPVKIICSMDEYKKKIEDMASEKGVYGDEYLLQNITAGRMKEMKNTLMIGEGFIN
jgi:maltose O-acetyltransferase